MYEVIPTSLELILVAHVVPPPKHEAVDDVRRPRRELHFPPLGAGQEGAQTFPIQELRVRYLSTAGRKRWHATVARVSGRRKVRHGGGQELSFGAQAQYEWGGSGGGEGRQSFDTFCSRFPVTEYLCPETRRSRRYRRGVARA